MFCEVDARFSHECGSAGKPGKLATLYFILTQSQYSNFLHQLQEVTIKSFIGDFFLTYFRCYK